MNATPQSGFSRRQGFNGWRKRTIVTAGKRLRRGFDAVIAHYSAIPATPVLDNRLLPWTRELEANWRPIRAEALQILAERETVPPLSEVSPDHGKIARGEEWRCFFLYAYGYRIDANCARCPDTVRLIQHVPGLQTAMFSMLEPGAWIPPHRGVTKAIFNCHLGLVIPGDSEQCWIEIDGVRHGWTEGKLLAFDDTFHHEVRNQTAHPRVVLLLQARRPVRFPGDLAADFFLGAVRHSPFVGDGLKNLKQWQPHGRAGLH